ncbi:hypothetical protein FACS1894184_19120 [Clostridia bacterium]|nr:hypothetical protein FACS1894184_19120 [Clostridia bacterium]
MNSKLNLHQMNLYDIAWILLSTLILYQFSQLRFINSFQYFDEIITVFLFALAVLHSKENQRISQDEKIYYITMIIIVIIGFVGNLYSKIPRSLYAISVDLIASLRMLITLWATRVLFNSKKAYNVIISQIKIFVCVAFFFMVVNLVSDANLGMKYDVRFGLNSFQFIFPHPTVLVSSMCNFLALLTFDGVKKNMKYILIVLLLIISSFRSKGIGLVLMYIYVLLFMNKQQFKLNRIIPLIPIAIYTVWDNISIYFMNGTSARLLLHLQAINVANNYFPVGAGYSAYETYGAIVDYSSIYLQNGFNSVYGLSQEMNSFAIDAFWPAILGQFGRLGVIVFIYGLYKIYRATSKNVDFNNSFPLEKSFSDILRLAALLNILFFIPFLFHMLLQWE